MARNNSFTCDKCGTKWEGYEEIKKSANPVLIELRLGFNGSMISEWCRECAVKAGVTFPRQYDAEEQKIAPSPTPTTEDLLVELLETLGFMRQE